RYHSFTCKILNEKPNLVTESINSRLSTYVQMRLTLLDKYRDLNTQCRRIRLSIKHKIQNFFKSREILENRDFSILQSFFLHFEQYIDNQGTASLDNLELNLGNLLHEINGAAFIHKVNIRNMDARDIANTLQQKFEATLIRPPIKFFKDLTTKQLRPLAHIDQCKDVLVELFNQCHTLINLEQFQLGVLNNMIVNAFLEHKDMLLLQKVMSSKYGDMDIKVENKINEDSQREFEAQIYIEAKYMAQVSPTLRWKEEQWVILCVYSVLIALLAAVIYLG
ncbi:unnamed protein product, partial [Owenia fusiformis]